MADVDPMSSSGVVEHVVCTQCGEAMEARSASCIQCGARNPLGSWAEWMSLDEIAQHLLAAKTWKRRCAIPVAPQRVLSNLPELRRTSSLYVTDAENLPKDGLPRQLLSFDNVEEEAIGSLAICISPMLDCVYLLDIYVEERMRGHRYSLGMLSWMLGRIALPIVPVLPELEVEGSERYWARVHSYSCRRFAIVRPIKATEWAYHWTRWTHMFAMLQPLIGAPAAAEL